MRGRVSRLQAAQVPSPPTPLPRRGEGRTAAAPSEEQLDLAADAVAVEAADEGAEALPGDADRVANFAQWELHHAVCFTSAPDVADRQYNVG